jgi:hypothetical protein
MFQLERGQLEPSSALFGSAILALDIFDESGDEICHYAGFFFLKCRQKDLERHIHARRTECSVE